MPMKLPSLQLTCCVLLLTAVSCAPSPNESNANTNASPVAVASPTQSTQPATAANAQPVTLPVLDAFFADQSFSDALRARLQLTDDQITRLKELAHVETSKLNEATAGQTEGETAAARTAAQEKVSAVIGPAKAEELSALVRERWNDSSAAPGATPAEKSQEPKTNPMTKEEFAAMAPNTVPTDSRIIVNTPAFRMDVFENGQLVKSYKVGIGYPQFPLPNALRKANTIIFNPTWTPPDEPWVAKMKNVTVGEKIEAGSSLNPLGPIKIPIGLPSLIHGGKSPAKLGTFASHGCVGLTTPQVKGFAKVLAQTAGSDISDKTMEAYLRDSTKTKAVKLPKTIPVELRYETIVLEDGKLHIYKDVYDQDTNTEENLRAVLQANGTSLEDLSEDERAQALDALNAMSAHPTKSTPRPANVSRSSNANQAVAGQNAKNAKAKRPVKNQKEVVIEIARLSGKGYPGPVDLDTGTGKPSPKVALK